MKDLIKEIKRATSFRETWREVTFLHYLINKRHYDFVYDYAEGKEVVYVYKGDDFVGILHSKFPIGFILEATYEDFKDLNCYHLVKVNNLDEAEWSVDKQELKKIAPEITWGLDDEEAVNSKQFSIQDFAYATN